MPTLKDAHIFSMETVNNLKENGYNTALIPKGYDHPVLLSSLADAKQLRRTLEAVVAGQKYAHKVEDGWKNRLQNFAKDIFDITRPGAIISDDVVDMRLLLPNEQMLSWEEQCKAAMNIDKEALRVIYQYNPADSYFNEEVIDLFLQILLAEQIENDKQRKNSLHYLANNFADIIAQIKDNVPARFAPEVE